jgi:hypothetical protein
VALESDPPVGVPLEVTGVAFEPGRALGEALALDLALDLDLALTLGLALGEILALDRVINWTLPPSTPSDPPPAALPTTRGATLLAIGAGVPPDIAKYEPTATITIAADAAIPRTAYFR